MGTFDGLIARRKFRGQTSHSFHLSPSPPESTAPGGFVFSLRFDTADSARHLARMGVTSRNRSSVSMVAGVASMSVHLFTPPRDVAVHRQPNLCRPCSDGFLPDRGPCVRDTDNGETATVMATTTKTLRPRRTQRPTPLPSFPLLQPKLRPQCQVSSTSFTPSSPPMPGPSATYSPAFPIPSPFGSSYSVVGGSPYPNSERKYMGIHVIQSGAVGMKEDGFASWLWRPKWLCVEERMLWIRKSKVSLICPLPLPPYRDPLGHHSIAFSLTLD